MMQMSNATRAAKVIALVLAMFLAVGTPLLILLLFRQRVGVFESVQIVGAILVPVFAVILGYYFNARQIVLREVYERKIDEIEIKAEQQPERTRFAWDIASIKLEAYFNRNLAQVNLIFWISVGVMAVGFGFILFGISRSMTKPDVITPSYIAAIAGIITELIGATFMLIYRSTMKQASTYMATLERINSVGMAVQILDSISAEDVELKNFTKSELVKLLLNAQAAVERPSRRATRPASRKVPAADPAFPTPGHS
jgi:hypothetical protein